MSKGAIPALLAGAAIACTPWTDAEPVAPPAKAPLAAEGIRLDILSSLGPMVLQGDRMERLDAGNRIVITRNASWSLPGPTPVHAEADRIETQLNRHTVTLSGRVRFRFSYSLPPKPGDEPRTP